MNVRFQNAIAGIPQSVPPIWLMRQAGRYHSHYRALRTKHSFVEMCKIPELAAEVARGPIAEFDFDLAILFSDLLFPLEALGMPLSYGDGGPELGMRLSFENLNSLKSVEEALPELQFQGAAVRATRDVLPKDKSLIGFVGGPFTLFAYACGCRRSDRCEEAKQGLSLMEEFCQGYLIGLTRAQIELQLKAGAEVVMILDPLAGTLSPSIFKDRYLPLLNKLVLSLPGPVGYYLRGATEAHLSAYAAAKLPIAGIGFDHRVQISQQFSRLKSGFIQGNFDEALMFLKGNELDRELDRFFTPLLELSPSERAGWICGLGHGVLPGTPEESVRRFVNKARTLFAASGD